MDPQLTTIQLTDEDAASFINFQKDYDVFFEFKRNRIEFNKFIKHVAFIKILDGIGVFDMKNSSVTINFNNHGEIGSIDKVQHFRP